MYNDMKILAVVTARGGSKGLPGKNVRDFCGKPLVAWAVEAALSAKLVDHVVVSTDDQEIADAAKMAGGDVPFMRPAELANDTASSIDVVLHAIDWLAERGQTFNIVVMVEPTSPLRMGTDIDAALRQMIDGKAPAIAGICEAECTHPAFMFRLEENSRMVSYTGQQPNSLRRQDLDATYYLEGSVYASLIPVLREKRGYYHADTIGFVVPKWMAVEIDDIDDFIMAEALFKHKVLDA